MPNDLRYWTRDENARLARRATEAPRIPWDKFKTIALATWEPGQHFSVIGPTGLGKTTMLLNVLPLHPFVTVMATKPKDPVMDALIRNYGYLKMERWRSLDAREFPRRVLWPDARSIESYKTQKPVFHDAFDKIYREGNWTVALDETWYVDDILGLGKDIRMFLLQARSLSTSLVSAFQRPAWVPRELYSQSTHLMFWKTEDETDLKSLSGMGFRSAALIKDIVSGLDLFQVLYMNTRTGLMARTRCPEVNTNV